MEHVGPLAVSLQKALRFKEMESEVYFVSAILSTLTRVLNEKSDEKEYQEIQHDQETDQENDPARYELKPMVKEQSPAEVVEAMVIQHSMNSFENVAKTNEAKENDLKTSPEDENSPEERNLTDDEKEYILGSV